ncbi:MAG: hypothetical protein ACFFBD_08805 [Candidatus Hodarchaeota archaeon]
MSHLNCDRDYKNHLQTFFQYLYNNGDVNAKCPQISGYAKRIFNKLKSYSDNANWALSIDPPWAISLEDDEDFLNRSAYLLISGKIIVENSMFTFYSFSVSVVMDSDIIRRFHFDVDTGIKKILKPKCHVQYGGKAHEKNSMPHLNYLINPEIKKPRFPFPPLDIILLLDLTTRQFVTSLGKKFVKESFWKNLVKKSERARLNEYYNQILQYFNNLNTDKLTLFEKMCY